MKKLVFDVGASAIKFALMDDEATIYEKGSEVTPHDSLEQFLQVIKTIYKRYKEDVDGIAFSIPGTVDSETGQIFAPGGLTYNENVNLIDAVHAIIDLPVAVENDGKSAALAEAWKGNLKDCNDGVVLVLGSGIGGGIIKDGKLWKGKNLFAGEFSYVLYGEGNSFQDVWAMSGSTSALLMDVATRKGIDMASINGVTVFEMIAQQDHDAVAALQTLAKNIARGMFNIQCMMDPEKILIGGGISQQPILCESIQLELDKLYSNIPFVIPHVQLGTCQFYNDSNLVGALYNFLNHQ